MRNLALTLSVLAVLFAADRGAQAQSCKVCAEQQKARMKNYASLTCKSEYQMCMKSCGKKS